MKCTNGKEPSQLFWLDMKYSTRSEEGAIRPDCGCRLAMDVCGVCEGKKGMMAGHAPGCYRVRRDAVGGEARWRCRSEVAEVQPKSRVIRQLCVSQCRNSTRTRRSHAHQQRLPSAGLEIMLAGRKAESERRCSCGVSHGTGGGKVVSDSTDHCLRARCETPATGLRQGQVVPGVRH